jgi:hypothetical protein
MSQYHHHLDELINHWKSYFIGLSEEETKQGKEIIKTFGQETERDLLADLLILNWTGKSFHEQGKILYETYGKGNRSGKSWYKVLADRSRNHMIELSKKMDDGTVDNTLYKIRQISYLAERFGDILYDEKEARDRKKKIDCV